MHFNFRTQIDCVLYVNSNGEKYRKGNKAGNVKSWTVISLGSNLTLARPCL